MAQTTRTRTQRPTTAPAKAASAAASPAATVRPVALPDDLWERIARKAYELYEQGGRQDGRAIEDWLEAETVVMQELHEARE